MAFYDKFPYTNFQEINLDRLIQELIKVKEGLDFVIENASLKYADPIQWNITHQYAANTVVIDPETGIAYISTKPVPDNILITNTGYWTPIFDLSQFFDETETQITALQTAIDTLNTTTETHSTDIHDLKDDTEALAQDIEAQAQNITNIQTSITNMQSEIDNIEIGISGNPVNVLTLGVKNDGSQDCSQIINVATKLYDLYFPAGTYLINNPIVPEKSLIGAGNTRIETGGISVLKMNFDSPSKGVIDFTDCTTFEPLLISDFNIECSAGTGYAIKYAPSDRILLELKNITISNNKNWAIYIAPAFNTSRPVYARNISIKGDGNNGGNGIYINENAGDCQLQNLEIMYVDVAIENHANILRLTEAHLFGGRTRTSTADIDNHWPATQGINNYGSIYADNIYIDSFFQGWVQRGSVGSVGNLIVWFDNWMNGASRTDGTCLRTLPGSNLDINHLTVCYCPYIGTLYDGSVTIDSVTYRSVPSYNNIVSHGVPWGQPGCRQRMYPKITVGNTNYVMISAFFASRSNAGRSRSIITIGGNEMYQFTTATGTANTLTMRAERINGYRNLYYKKIANGVVGIFVQNIADGYAITQEIQYSTPDCAPLMIYGMIDTALPQQTDTNGLTALALNTDVQVSIY